MISDGQHVIHVARGVSINVFQALKKALAAAPRATTPMSGQLDYLRRRLEAAETRLRTLSATSPHPLRYAYRLSSRTVHEPADRKAARIRRELLDAGITLYGLLKSESRYLPKIMHDNEHVEAIVYGQHHSSSVMLIATDERIVFLDKKPMATMFDEVSYEVISGIEFDIHIFFATLVLHTPVKNYDIKFANLRCAERFARHIEKQRLEREEPANEPEVIDIPKEHIDHELREAYPLELKEDMAGYYWLPTEEEERRRVQGQL